MPLEPSSSKTAVPNEDNGVEMQKISPKKSIFVHSLELQTI